MGKDSLIKSTSKKAASKETEEDKKKKKKTKKAAPVKKTSSKAKKTAAKKTTVKKATAKKKTAKKTTVKKTAAKKKTPAKAPAKSSVKKASPPKKKKAVSVKDLIFKKFDLEVPKTLYTPEITEPVRDYTAPPIISTTDKKEAARLKAVLFQKYAVEDLRAAAEAAVAEIAAAEIAAAEVAVAEKAAELEPEVSVSYEPPPVEKAPADPVDKMFTYGIGGFVLLVLILIASSVSNSGNFYLNPANGGLEIWKGRFAPMGNELLITLPGVSAPEEAREVYTRREAYPFIFNYYVEKSDALLDAPGLPDYEEITVQLNKALSYAVTAELQDAAYARLDSIELMTLLYKADVAASKNTIEGYKAAIDFLNQGASVASDGGNKDLIDKKIESAKAELEALEARAATEAEAETQESAPAGK